jgi:hypothetical protein
MPARFCHYTTKAKSVDSRLPSLKAWGVYQWEINAFNRTGDTSSRETNEIDNRNNASTLVGVLVSSKPIVVDIARLTNQPPSASSFANLRSQLKSVIEKFCGSDDKHNTLPSYYQQISYAPDIS